MVWTMSDRLLLPLFVVLWSSGYVVGAAAVEIADPLPLLAARFVLASLVAVPVVALKGKGRWRDAPLGRLAVAGLLLHVVQFGGIYGGFALGVPAALSALVMLGLSPLVTTSLAIAAGQERGDARLWGGLAFGVVGVAISLGPELGSAQVGIGIALTIVGMLGLAGGTVLQKRWVGTTDPLTTAAVHNVTAGLVVVPAAVLVGGHLDVSLHLAAYVLWLGLVLAVATVLLFVHLLRGHAASTVGALLLLVPPVTAGVSALTLGEALHPASLAGMLVAMVGVGVVLRREAQPASASAHGANTSAAARLSAKPLAPVRAE
jgi:drug/metabolite transporter (DMT)-like permease